MQCGSLQNRALNWGSLQESWLFHSVLPPDRQQKHSKISPTDRPSFSLFQGFSFHSDGIQAGEEPGWDPGSYLQGFRASGQRKTLRSDGEAGVDPGRASLVPKGVGEKVFIFLFT